MTETARSANVRRVGTDLPGMSFGRFWERYGASVRRKHLMATGILGWTRLLGSLLLGQSVANERMWALPPRSGLPLEFIRIEPWEAEYLFLLAARAQQGILEIGRFRGGTTFLLACANRKVPIWSIDVAPDDDAYLQTQFVKDGVGENVTLLVGDSHADPFPEIGGYDLLFVDGDHSYEGCFADLEAFVPGLTAGGHLLVHDCYAGTEVQPAVLDFVVSSELRAVRSPFIISTHWQTSYGSLAHFVKDYEASG